MLPVFRHDLCSADHPSRTDLQRCTRRYVLALDSQVQIAIGPRREGGVYWSSYYDQTYRVAEIKWPTDCNWDWYLILVWENGDRTKSRTAWRDGLDRIQCEPWEAPTVEIRLGTALAGRYAASACGPYAEYGR